MIDLEKLEFPLPIISVDREAFHIKTSFQYQDSFRIKNIGGGLLAGEIFSNSSFLQITPEKFSSNDTEIDFLISLHGFQLGDLIETSILIVSSGGALQIPLHIQLTAQGLQVASTEIHSLQAFASFAEKNPMEASFHFRSASFREWLEAIYYDKMDMYEYFRKAANKEAALDNFLVMNRLKERANLLIPKDVYLEAGKKDGLYRGKLPFTMAGNGFLYRRLESTSPLLKFATSEITQASFLNEQTIEIEYEIALETLWNKVNTFSIFIYDIYGKCVETCTIFLTLGGLIEVSISKTKFGDTDSGAIYIYNHTGENIIFHIKLSAASIQFKGKQYLIDREASIPFVIESTILQKAQAFFRRHPYEVETISVSASSKSSFFSKKFNVQIGALFIKG